MGKRHSSIALPRRSQRLRLTEELFNNIYIIQNLFMLIRFLPNKNNIGTYFTDLRESKDEHIDRYSNKHATIAHSTICLLVTGCLFYLNYSYQFAPRNIAVWFVFVFFPYVLLAFDFGVNKISRTK